MLKRDLYQRVSDGHYFNLYTKEFVENLIKTADNFCKRIEDIHNDPEYFAVWAMYANHVAGGYKGPKYTKELDELKAALAVKEVR